MKINNTNLGELEVSYKGWLLITINNKEIKCKTPRVIGNQSVVEFYKKQIICGKEVQGLKVEENEYLGMLELIETGKKEKELEDFKGITSFSYYSTEQIYTPHFLDYNYAVIEATQKKIEKMYKTTTESVETMAGSVAKITVNVTGEELIELLEETKLELNIKKEIKKLETEKLETEKLEALKKQAKETNERVELSKYEIDCDDDSEACDIDLIVTYINPDGTYTTEIEHTW